jgi:hypothetical protein
VAAAAAEDVADAAADFALDAMLEAALSVRQLGPMSMNTQTQDPGGLVNDSGVLDVRDRAARLERTQRRDCTTRSRMPMPDCG